MVSVGSSEFHQDLGFVKNKKIVHIKGKPLYVLETNSGAEIILNRKEYAIVVK